MDNQKVYNGLAVVAANYVKRWLEDPYDKIFQTEIGQKIKNLDTKAKYAIEFASYLLTAFFDQKLKDDTALKKFVQGVGTDVGPELSKRMINGAKERLESNAVTKEEKDLVSFLLQLDQTVLMELLDWLYRVEPDERTHMIKQLHSLSLSDIEALMKMDPEARTRLLNLLLVSPKKRFSLPPQLVEDMDKATLKLKAISGRLKKK